ncbi:helix-turn-helix domain-containing protein [Planctomycetota bacterium]
MEQVAKAISDSGKTRYRIYKDTGISQTVLHRIVVGTHACNMETLNTLCDYLNLELAPKGRKAGK